MADTSVDPPNSRLFVLCSKTITEEDLRDAFSKHGTIEDIWIVKDKSTNENKGVVYIKYSKTSEAALAMEEMNGTVLPSSPKPIKVMVAHSREQGSRRDDDADRLLRLFIVVPRTANEDEIKEHFKQFGDVDYISIVKNRDTGESKGFAYVKFTKPYYAAKAFEECSKSYRAVFARPREPKVFPNSSSFDSMGGGRSSDSKSVPKSVRRLSLLPINNKFYPGHSLLGDGRNAMSYSNGGDKWGGDSGGGGNTRLTALVSTSLRDQHVFRLFDIIPGLQICRPIHERGYNNSGMQKILLQYSSQSYAQHALEKLNGFEYPIGHRITVKLEAQPPSHMESSGRGSFGMSSGSVDLRGGGEGGPMTTISSSELTTLTKALAKAESIIKAAGLGSVGGDMMNSSTYDSNYCSVKLPPPQPLSTSTELAERLFIVCQPGLPPMYALRDVFGRFGNMIEVYVLNGRNCGYVSYSDKESAEQAIETLHLQEVCGMRLKVMKAEPPPGGPSKRIKVDEDAN